MNIKLANTLFDDGIFSALYKADFITSKVLFTARSIFGCRHKYKPVDYQSARPFWKQVGNSIRMNVLYGGC